MNIDDLASYGVPPALVDVWSEHVGELTEIQQRAVEAGALDGSTNLLVVAPTSSGKTFVGEIAATASAYSRRRHAIFIVPFRALAEEHYLLFRERYGELLSVVISTSSSRPLVACREMRELRRPDSGPSRPRADECGQARLAHWLGGPH